MKSSSIQYIAKRFMLNHEEEKLLEKILSLSSNIDINDILNIRVFEKYVQNWIDQNQSIKEKDERILNKIRKKFNFFDAKYPLFSTKYLTTGQEAFINDERKISIILYKNSENKLFWKLDEKFLKNFRLGETININLLRKEDGKFYKFKSKILEISNIFGITLLKTSHSNDFYIRQKRAYERYMVDLEIEIKYKTLNKQISTYKGKIKNLSLGGAQIELKNFDKNIDEKMKISIKTVFENKIFFINSEFRYIIKNKNKTTIGVKFLNLNKELESAIYKYLKKYKPE